MNEAQEKKVFIDLTVDDVPLGTIKITLDGNLAPRAADQFVSLCTAGNGYGYHRTFIHHIQPGVMLLGGSNVSVSPFELAADDYRPMYAERGTVSLVGDATAAFIIRMSCERLDGKTVVLRSRHP